MWGGGRSVCKDLSSVLSIHPSIHPPIRHLSGAYNMPGILMSIEDCEDKLETAPDLAALTALLTDVNII
jgi:hypothetical protein